MCISVGVRSSFSGHCTIIKWDLLGLVGLALVLGSHVGIPFKIFGQHGGSFRHVLVIFMNNPISLRPCSPLPLPSQNGEETQFKIKKTTKMGKVFKAYAERKGISQSTLRFLLDGERVADDQTAKMLELEDGDQIDAVLEQVGGSA